MMERQREEVHYEDEIDLYELWLRLKKRWRVILGTVVVFMLASMAYILIAKPVYKTTFIVRVPTILFNFEFNSEKVVEPIISPSEAVEYVNVIKNLLKEKRYKDIERILNIDRNEILSIHSLSARELKKSEQTIEITLEVYDPSIINRLSGSILDYLNRNKLVAERIDVKRRELEEQIKVISERVKALEETKKLVNKSISQGKEINFNPAEVDKTIQDLESRLISIKALLKTLKGFEISVNPTIPKEPSKPKKSLILAVSLTSSLFLGIFLALFLEWLEEARRRYLERSIESNVKIS